MWEVVRKVHLGHGKMGGQGWLVHGSFGEREKNGRVVSLAQNSLFFYCLISFRGIKSQSNYEMGSSGNRIS